MATVIFLAWHHKAEQTEAASQELEWTVDTRCPETHSSHSFCHKQHCAWKTLALQQEKGIHPVLISNDTEVSASTRWWAQMSKTKKKKKTKNKSQNKHNKTPPQLVIRRFHRKTKCFCALLSRASTCCHWKRAEQIASEGSGGSRRPVGVITGGKCQCLWLAAKWWRWG